MVSKLQRLTQTPSRNLLLNLYRCNATLQASQHVVLLLLPEAFGIGVDSSTEESFGGFKHVVGGQAVFLVENESEFR
ncbi:hypothetical protein HanIR_Chr16g0842301 [Helianthus annuus]|nr:hypothetical protein HanIR_Chr16g0842301 [Helianthus annuus]